VHWFKNNTPTAANANFDLWPDTSELDADELFSTSMTYSDGTPAKLYSAYKQKTVVRHFQMDAENNLDGVFFQRFLSDLNGANISALRNQVAVNVRVGAETYGRVFAIMYDISGYATNTLVSKLTNDWLYLVNTQRVTNSPPTFTTRANPSSPSGVLVSAAAPTRRNRRSRPLIGSRRPVARSWVGCRRTGGP
jgi:hypothetical protein